MAAVGSGFCPDEVPKNPKVAFIFDMPSKADIRERRPLAGEEGVAWQRLYIEELGYKREDILLSTALRCGQPNDKYGQPEYPREPLRRQAEINCRHYDTELIAFDPNLFIITYHPRNSRLVGCMARMVRNDVAKAFRFASQGYRPAVLLGEGVARMYYPWLSNMKDFRGHIYQGESPWTLRRERSFPAGD